MDQIALLHFSDTHFGGQLVNTQFPRIEGWGAHDILLCRAIPPALDDARVLSGLSDNEMFHVAVSGDLTCKGDVREFPVAHSFFQSLWYLRRPPSRGIGLNAPDSRLVYVPGNHDYWNGQKFPPPAYTPSIFHQHFRPTPWRVLWRSPEGKLELEVYGIDSNSGLEGQRSNLFARGSFAEKELRRLESLLQESDKLAPPLGVTRVRTILTHHSLAYSGGVAGIQTLDKTSRQRLLDLTGKYRISAILTGHTHDFYFDNPFFVPIPGEPYHEVYELRSATTLQGQKKPRSNTERGFLFHLIRLDGGRPTWPTWRYQWDHSSRFIRWADAPCSTFYC